MILSEFKPDNEHLGILSQETFDNIQEYLNNNEFWDSIQRKIGWRSLRARHYYLSSLDQFSTKTDIIPNNLTETNGINEFVEPKGYKGHLEWFNKDSNYLNHTGALFWGGLAETYETGSTKGKKFYASSKRLATVFEDQDLVQDYPYGDIYFQFLLSIPASIKNGEYTVVLLNKKFKQTRFNDTTPTSISYKVSRSNGVETYKIVVTRGSLAFERLIESKEVLTVNPAFYKIALKTNDQVEIWAADSGRIVQGYFFDVFNPVDSSDPLYVEPTLDALRDAKISGYQIPKGVGFYGQTHEREKNSSDRVSFSYLHLSNKDEQAEMVQDYYKKSRDGKTN